MFDKYFNKLDLYFAEKSSPLDASANEKLLLSYLFLASRNGHIAVRITKDTVEPAPEIFNESLEAAECEALAQCLIQAKGACNLPICSFEDFYYLERSFKNESALLNNLVMFTQSAVEIEIDSDSANRVISEYLNSNKLLFAQAEAIRKSLQGPITLITGGPGTGKSYTAANFMTIFWELLEDSEKEHLEIAISAPTGKAAMHLYKSLKKLLKDERIQEHISAKTLHALLGIRKEQNALFDTPTNYISADLVIVDECSMIDLELMVKLFASLKKGSRLILIGDPYQLPPVESGSVFADICSCLKDQTAHLYECMRSDLKPLLELAKTINQGDFEESIELMNKYSFKAPYALEKEILPMMIQQFSMSDEASHFRVLSPLRHGLLGVDYLNRHCMQALRERAFALNKPFLAPIMITESNYKLELYNGEMGTILYDSNGICEFAEFQGRKIPIMQLPRYEYAYCISVHKSQGSEFDHVLLLMPEGSEVFGREVLYTAVTRARKSLQVFGCDKVLSSAIARPSRRLSALAERFCNYLASCTNL